MSTIHLYVKRHKSTGLLYFGKTTRKDPERYLGSGSYWRRHLQKHGNDIETISVWSFDCLEEATSFALKFSSDNNIVESADWANLIPEDASYGGLKGFKHSPESRRKMSQSSKGNKHHLGKAHSDESKAKMSAWHKSKKLSPEHRKNISLSKVEYWTDERRKEHSARQRGRGIGTNNSQYGRCWMTDGHNNIKVSLDEVCGFNDKGYVRGRTIIKPT